MTTEKKRSFIINFFYALIIITIVYFIFEYALSFMMPFLIAYIVSAILRPVVGFMSRKMKIKHKIGSVIAVIIFYIVVCAILFVVGARTVVFVKEQFVKLPEIYKNKIEPILSMLFGGVSNLPDDFDPTIAAALESISTNLMSYIGSIVSTLSGAIVSWVSSFATSLPSLVIKIIFSVIASYYFTADYDIIHDFVYKQCKPETCVKINAVRVAIRDIVWSYLKSYTIILFVTFVELIIAMLIFGAGNPVAVALIIAIFDILPVVGTGTILIPWSIIQFVNKDYTGMIILLVAYVVIFIVRNIIEPKIVGRHVGLHPLVTLLAMFVGTMLFGMLGLFGVPITMALLCDLNDKGVIEIFKTGASKKTGDDENNPDDTPPAGGGISKFMKTDIFKRFKRVKVSVNTPARETDAKDAADTAEAADKADNKQGGEQE